MQHSLEEHEPVPLAVHHQPVSVTFALFGDDGQLFVVDPTHKEELVCSGTLSVSTNLHRELCGMQKLGGAALTADELIQFTQLAHDKAAELIRALDHALRVDAEQRAKGVWTRDQLHAPKITENALAEQDVDMASETDELDPIQAPPVQYERK